MLKKITLLLTALALIAASSCALAATPVNGPSFSGNSALYDVLDFKFHHYEHGIGYGTCPVYTAPSSTAYRCVNGKAAIDTNYDMWVGGYDRTGWLLVRYETNNGGCRVGYIPPESVRGFKTDIDVLAFSYIPQTAVAQISVTDNPLVQNSTFAVLSPGEEYHILGKYTYYGNWWYIEFYVGSQIARGFINRDTTPVDLGDGVYTTDLGFPAVSPLGTTQIGTVTVTGDGKIVRQNAGTEYEMVARVNSGEMYPAYSSKTGTNGRTWYYLYIDGVWGWISSGVVRFN